MENGFAVTYRLHYHESNFTYRLGFDSSGLINDPKPSQNLPEWTRLTVHQCSNCPYTSAQKSHCPIAVNISLLVKDWSEITSFEKLELTVETPQRTIIKMTDLQSALRSILGLVMSGSDCNHTRFFRLMARLHLPLSNSEETVTRAVSTYLLQQFLMHEKGGKASVDLTGLHDVYHAIGIVNLALSQRLKSLEIQDGIINALVGLDTLGKTIVFSLDDSLDYLKEIFPPDVG